VSTEQTGTRHTWVDDAVGLGCGAVVMSTALLLLSAGGVVTGGTAGLALLLSYAIPVPFGVLFVLINLPFFALALWQKGWRFTLRSLLTVLVTSALVQLQQLLIGPFEIPAGLAAVVGNVLAGVGLLILFRHASSLGGFGILALLAQERLGWRAGYVQLALDAVVVLSSLAVSSPLLVLVSALGAAVLNGVIAVNHRPGRYTGH
jgi:uncharacterized membrane-anchored protein YitT (DUF2179 family)